MSRQRYYQFTVRSIRTFVPVPYSKGQVDALKAQFAMFFEMTERLARVHAEIFQSPAVRPRTYTYDTRC
jgi:hypothetical protein